ncbi:GNAT family N-acetyltransferase [Paenibacillus pini]|uniref:Acetyltransferase n=1 Tax=Paenibacillus pini JCM 16418 TaxID=1236976 RepID=W7Z564_9BACL|nr:GNAT family N-acetyltransferase [Paenibacillus pini]GAF09464.1 acetyltransferase [Paenibacillus pini JCM 16418]
MAEPFVITNTHLNQEITAAMAVHDDHEAVNGLLLQTATWLKSIGSTSGMRSSWEKISMILLAVFLAGKCLSSDRMMINVGVVILQPRANAWDRKLWGEDGHESSVYLHRLAIHRDYAGQDLGSDILQWALTGIQFAGKDRIRLDCIAGHEKLNALYLRNGFTLIETTPNGFNTYERLV